MGFADGKALPTGLAEGSRHTPSLLNVAGQRWFFWDGRADTLWSQALHPFERAEEFGSNRLAVLHRVHEDPVLRTEYESVFGPMPPLDDSSRFPDDASPDAKRDSKAGLAWRNMTEVDQEACNRAFSNLGKAIAAYEHRLVPPPSRFDEFVTAMLAGDSKAMIFEFDGTKPVNVRASNPVDLNPRHGTELKSERDRILQAGGKISASGAVYGVLYPSRGFGDLSLVGL